MIQELCLNLQFSSLALSDTEILAIIGPDKMAEIKAKDKNPKFAVYAVGQEGKSNPTILGEQSKPIMWMKEGISKLAKAIKAGTKLFFGHNKDNSTEGREAYGEVVASCERMIQGKNTAIAVCYIPKEKQEFVGKQDIVSMEAVIEMVDQGMEYVADSIQKVTGLAIGSSDKWQPAMPGAKQLMMVQAMSTDQATLETAGGKPKMEVTFQDVQKFIQERKVFPSQLYKPHEIFGQPVKTKDGKVYYQGGDRVLQDDANEYFQNQFKEQADIYIKENEELKNKSTELEKKAKDYYLKVAKQEYIPHVEQVAKDKKFPDTALKILKLKTKNIDIPEDETERAKLTDRILAEVEEEHKELFGDKPADNKQVPAGALSTGVDDQETF